MSDAIIPNEETINFRLNILTILIEKLENDILLLQKKKDKAMLEKELYQKMIEFKRCENAE